MNDYEDEDDILKKKEMLDFYVNLVREYWHKKPKFDLADSAELVSDVPRKTGDEYRAAYELGMKTTFDEALFESDCTFGFVDGLLDGLYLLPIRLEEEVIKRNEEIEAEELAREEKAAEIIEKLEERLHESGGILKLKIGFKMLMTDILTIIVLLKRLINLSISQWIGTVYPLQKKSVKRLVV